MASCRSNALRRVHSPRAAASNMSSIRRAGEQEIPDQRLAAINAPQKSRDALGVSAFYERWIFFHGSCHFRRLAAGTN